MRVIKTVCSQIRKVPASPLTGLSKSVESIIKDYLFQVIDTKNVLILFHLNAIGGVTVQIGLSENDIWRAIVQKMRLPSIVCNFPYVSCVLAVSIT